jgi:plastocyanin
MVRKHKERGFAMTPVRPLYFFIAVIAALVSFSICSTAVTARAEQKNDEESVKVIVLQNKPFGVTPGTLSVKKGTTIIWFNKDSEPVTIAFVQPLGPACKMPVNFYSNLEGIFETGLIPQSGIASMCIVEPGAYDFKVWRLVSKATEKPRSEIVTGKIVVE